MHEIWRLATNILKSFFKKLSIAAAVLVCKGESAHLLPIGHAIRFPLTMLFLHPQRQETADGHKGVLTAVLLAQMSSRDTWFDPYIWVAILST